MQTSVDRFLKRNKRINDIDRYQDMTSLFRVLDMEEYDDTYGIDLSEFKMHRDVQVGAYRKMVGAKLTIIYECPCKAKKKLKHHYNYDRPLEVMLLCYSCHRKEHQRLKTQSDPSGSDNLASHDELNGDESVVREDSSLDMVSSYAESVPCADNDTQTEAMTAV